MKEIAKYLFEIGSLKRTSRSGWQTAGIKYPESVAEHSFRTAVIGYILAKLENANAERTAILCLMHDVPESRILDLHKLAKRYLVITKEIEEEVIKSQVENLPINIHDDILEIFSEYSEYNSVESKIAHDADKLEMLLQAVEYKMSGYQVDDWIESALEGLKFDTSKKLAKAILSTDPQNWHRNI